MMIASSVGGTWPAKNRFSAEGNVHQESADGAIAEVDQSTLQRPDFAAAITSRARPTPRPVMKIVWLAGMLMLARCL